ncbi:hypothetical protein [Pseudomonas aeruginosa]|uniref:hypothetical protein n=1 Tax=Pseudomonas TaxID=286 RepID=UPI0015559AE9|nr:hypothetical protein [Pseudomonas aeruginosa]MBW6122479.1 hypothetical protein [Pseudomonas aeruginosa]MCV3954631.1 hypothetical protein [Pseudomonas aeruginosa]QKF01893.1 hypothetical protein HPT09_11080 [Pseudomonas aeruginosa]HBP5169528.1 hypothetical protein [Pseudomonas aeruginosa]HCF1530533.1 hypothetical protein [Pseudomonas aeruginosa]
MGLMRFLGLLFVLISIFAGSAAVVALVIIAVRFWPLMLVIVLTLVLFQFRPKSAHKSKR